MIAHRFIYALNWDALAAPGLMALSYIIPIHLSEFALASGGWHMLCIAAATRVKLIRH